jgi:hypothetical protein
MSPWHITMSTGEIDHGRYEGKRRHVIALVEGREGKKGQKPEDREKHEIMGAIGELAVAKCFNRYPSALIGRGAVDVANCIEVRTVPHAHYLLSVQAYDKGHLPFVLADTSALPIVHLRGWIFGWDAMRPDWWQDVAGNNQPAFYAQMLHRMEELAEWLGAWPTDYLINGGER